MINILRILLMVFSSYAVLGATITEDSICHYYSTNRNTIITYDLTATDNRLNKFYIKEDFIEIEILTSQPNQASVNGKYVTWHNHHTGDKLVIFVTVYNRCVNYPIDIQSVGRLTFPLLVK